MLPGIQSIAMTRLYEKAKKKVEKSTPAPKVQPKKENTPKPEKNKTEGKNNGNGFNSKVY